MKKIFVLFAVAGMITACGGSGEKKEGAATDQKTEAAVPADDLSNNPVYQKGVELIGKNDCLTCHKIDEKLVGPAYKDVAKKYASMDTAVDHLARKVIAGGSGVWGEVPMAPHAALSLDDAKALAAYVLLFKDK